MTSRLRKELKEKAKELGIPVDELLIQSKERSPIYMGSDTDHIKAKWAAELWRKAVEDREEDRIHGRGVHYMIVMRDMEVHPPKGGCSWDVYRNTETCSGYLKVSLTAARVLGYIPLDGLTDEKSETRTLTQYVGHETKPDMDDKAAPTGVDVPIIPSAREEAETRFDEGEWGRYAGKTLARQLKDGLSIDKATQSPYHVEIWSEKALPKEVKREARRHGVAVIVEGQGDLSYSVAHNVARRVNDAGKPGVIMYLSDYDEKGDNMATSMAAKLAWLDARGDLEHRVMVRQLAITEDQIERYDLPRKPVDVEVSSSGKKAHKTRVEDFEKRRGKGMTELNVLEQDLDMFREIFREGLEPLQDAELWRKNREAWEEWREAVEETVEEAAENADLEEKEEELREWLEEFNDALDDVKDELEEVKELKWSDPRQEWDSEVSRIISGLDLPEVEVPEGEGELPTGRQVLFDSQRSYRENVEAIRRYRNDPAPWT